MSKGRFYGSVAVIVVALTLLNTYFILKGKHENSKRASETRALAVGNRKLAVNNRNLALANCHSIGTLASIERAFITRQELQTQALLESGVTFGIPADQLPRLIDASKKSQAAFLHDLDALTASTCSDGAPSSAPVSKPHRRKAAKGGGHASTRPASKPTTLSAGGVAGAIPAPGPTSSRRASPRTLPVPRPTRTRIVTTTVGTPPPPSAAASAPPNLPPTVPAPAIPATPATPATPARPERAPVIPPVPCVKVLGQRIC